MLKYCIWRLSIVLCWLVLAFSQLGCASRYSVDALHALNPGAPVVQVCTRTPTVSTRAVVWAYNRVLHKEVSDVEGEAFEQFAKTADAFYRYDPHAPRDSPRNLPWPYQRMHCETLSAWSTPKLPKGLKEIPISDAAREALIAVLSASPEDVEEESAPLAVELKNQPIEKRFLAQVGGPSLIVSPQRRKDALLEAGQILRNAIRSIVPKVKGPDDEEISALDTDTGQLIGGVGLGVLDGGLPMGAVASDALIASGVLPKPTQQMLLGKGIGEMGIGLFQVGAGTTGVVGGGAASVTGGGAVVGVPVCIAGVALAANGAVTFINGAKTVILAVCYENELPAMAEAQPLAATALKGPNSPAAAAATAPAGGTSSGQSAAAPATNPVAAKPAPAKPANSGSATKPSTGKPVAVKKPCRYNPQQVSPSTTTWTICTGQMHHGISRVVHNALESHPNLKGIYKYRDNRFVTQAITKEAHKGYQKWHIALDKEVAKWIGDQQVLTPQAFEAYLIKRYAEPELKKIFPSGF